MMGAIFARGSCRALKWVALFGVVFALGAGSAVAQGLTNADGDFTISVDDATEGDLARITVTLKASVDINSVDAQVVTVTVSAAAASLDDAPAGSTVAEDGDFTLNEDTLIELDFGTNTGPDATEKMTKSSSVFLSTTHDTDAENEAVTISATATGASISGDDAPESKTIVIKDDETQKYVLKKTSDGDAKEGDEVIASLAADPPHTTQGSKTITLHLDQTPPFAIELAQTGGTVIPGNSTDIGGAAGAFSEINVTITTDENDENRVDDTITLTAYSGTAGDEKVEGTLEIALADIHKLPAVTAKAIALDEDGKALEEQPADGVMSIMEGQMIDVEITVVDKDGKATEAGEELMVSLLPTGSADSQDYRLNMHPVTIKLGDETGTVRLTATEGQDIGMETLMFDADVAGDSANGAETRMSMGILSVDIMDSTMKAVEAVSDEMIQEIVYAAKEAGAGDDMKFSPGEMMEVDASKLFMAAEGYALTYSAMSDNGTAASASTSGSMVKVMANEAAMGVHITVTATATMMSSGAKGLPQMSPNVAQVVFPVDVELADLMVTLSGPEDPNLVEGMSYEIKAMSNRPVTEDTMVELIQTDGTASPSDYMVENITIMAGEDMGSTMLMVNADEMMENENNMSEMLTLEGRVGTMSTNTLSFHLWDAAVPALPLIAQLLLAAFLAVGGYRRYLRR